MKNIDGKLWLWNIDSSIKDVSQLEDRPIYKYLISMGADLEIGSGIPPEYGNGIYCTNMTEKQYKELMNNMPREILFGNSKNKSITSNSAKVANTDTTNDGVEHNEPPTVDSIFKDITSKGENYYTASYHNFLFGFTGDIMQSIEESFHNTTLEDIDKLNADDKAILVQKLQNVVDSKPDKQTIYFFNSAIDHINDSLQPQAKK